MAAHDDDEERTVSRVEFPMEKLIPSGADCLVVIHAHKPSLIGKRLVLDQTQLRVGRGGDNELVLDGSSVSRRHCHFEAEGTCRWKVVDDGSTNGTYVNERSVPTAGQMLVTGDRITIGPAILKYLSGSDTEMKYHEEIYRLTISDGLTNCHNRRHMVELVDGQMFRARKHAQTLSAVMIDIDGFQRINDEHGNMAGDYVLRELAAVLRSAIRQSDFLGRYVGTEFAVVLCGTPLQPAQEFAESLRNKVALHRFEFAGDVIDVRVRMGCAELSADDHSAEDLLRRGEEFCYQAKRRGGDRVEGGIRGVKIRRILDGPAWLRRALASRAPDAQSHAPTEEMGGDTDEYSTVHGVRVRITSLIALEIDDEAAVHEILGAKAYEQWLRELQDDADRHAAANDLLGRWRDRFVLVATHELDPQRLTSRIVEDFSSRPTEGASARHIARSLKTSMLAEEEVDKLGERSLDILVARLTSRAPTGAITPAPAQLLPYPLAVFGALLTSRRTAYSRVRTLLDGLEMAMKFLAIIELSAIRDYAGPGELEAVAAMLSGRAFLGRPLSFGLWDDLAWRCATLLPPGVPAPIREVTLKLVRDRSQRSKLAEQIKGAVALRNEFQHRAAGRDEYSYAKEEDALSQLLERLVEACAPLGASRLVTVAEILSLADDDAIDYSLCLHRGAVEFFPVVQETIPAKLAKEWCYLLFDDHAPLSLAPFAFARTCETCGRLEMCLAEDIVLGPRGAKVRACGVTSAHAAPATVPGGRKLEVLYGLVSKAPIAR